jgi:hypothetical protein
MKSQGCILHQMMLAMFVLLAASMGHAQYGIRATIPFNFTIGTQSLSAGEDPRKPLPPPSTCPIPVGKNSNCPIRPPKL